MTETYNVEDEHFDAVREIVKRLHTGEGENMQTFSVVTKNIFEALIKRGWRPEQKPKEAE